MRTTIMVSDWHHSNLPTAQDEILRMRLTVQRDFTLSGILKTVLTAPSTLLCTLRILRERRIGLVAFHYPGLDAVGTAILKRCGLYRGRVMLCFHGTDVRMPESLIDRYSWRFVFRAADGVTACSKALAMQVAQDFDIPLERVSVVYNGVDTGTFSPTAADVLPPPLKIEAPRFIVSCGSYIVRKGHAYLLEGFAQIAGHHPDLHLVIAGADGPERRLLEARADALGLAGRVQCLTDLKPAQVAYLLARATACVQPSLAEPFGLAVIEAGACGTPVAASSVGGHGEILTNGETGLLFPAGDGAAIAAVLDRLVSEPELAARLALRLRQQVLERFTWKRCADEFLAVGYRRNA
jgi:glycosyltransferase involved in cell wall biosynthesis